MNPILPMVLATLRGTNEHRIPDLALDTNPSIIGLHGTAIYL